jgi:hypothetical protein
MVCLVATYRGNAQKQEATYHKEKGGIALLPVIQINQGPSWNIFSTCPSPYAPLVQHADRY